MILKNPAIALIIIFSLFMQNEHLVSQPAAVGIHGQISGWLLTNDQVKSENQLGIRYIPEILYDQQLSSVWQISGNVSANMFNSAGFHSFESSRYDNDLDLYRFWLRFSTSQFEVRAGLQKINFGAAFMLRPLMWFDRIDPRDPLQMTDGVYGLLARYYFLNNANIWLWGLYGNEDPKGWEILKTQENSVEFGGRIQYPFSRGEIGLTYHHRMAETPRDIIDTGLTGIEPEFNEHRFGIDTKWDLEVGIWMESVLIQRNIDGLPFKYQQMTTFGGDYTFALGNGLHAMIEHMRISYGNVILAEDELYSITASSVDYPIGLMDQLVFMFYYDWENSDAYKFLHWQRLYDNWSLHMIGFMNPTDNMLYSTNIISNPFSGNGFQIMIVYNY